MTPHRDIPGDIGASETPVSGTKTGDNNGDMARCLVCNVGISNRWQEQFTVIDGIGPIHNDACAAAVLHFVDAYEHSWSGAYDRAPGIGMEIAMRRLRRMYAERDQAKQEGR